MWYSPLNDEKMWTLWTFIIISCVTLH